MIDASRFFRKKEETVSPDSPDQREGGTVNDIPVDSIKPNPYQPRKNFDPEELEELTSSIQQIGLIQPILVKPSGDGYELIVGERRFRAAKMAGLEKIPAMVIHAEADDQQLIALVENIHRSDLSSVEEAESLQGILDKTGMTQRELARKVGRSQSSLANKLRLLKLDDRVKELLLSRQLGERQARALLSLEGDMQHELALKAVREDISASELEKMAKPNTDKSSIKNEDAPEKRKKRSRKKDIIFSGPDGPAGVFLKELSDVVEKERHKGVPIVMKVRELASKGLTVEIKVDFEENSF
jgi:ParB family chromosome partitioning protein